MRKVLKLVAYLLIIFMIIRMVIIVRDSTADNVLSALGIYYQSSPWLFWTLLFTPAILLAYLKVTEYKPRELNSKYTIEITCKATTQIHEYYIWFISKHYYTGDSEERRLRLEYCKELGESWLHGLSRDILGKIERKDTCGHQAINGDTFNPHYRLNHVTYPPIWIPINEVEYVKYTIFHNNKVNGEWKRKQVHTNQYNFTKKEEVK